MLATKTHFFLYRVAEDLWKRWGREGLRHSVIFLPSARSKLFLVRYLHELAGGQALVLPQWGNIRTEAERITTLDVVEPLLLLPEVFRLYREYAQISLEGEFADAFAEFYPAGMTILRDFDQIDKYLVNAQNLFENIDADAQITRNIDYLTQAQREWLAHFFTNVAKVQHSQLEKRYLQIWQVLYPIYRDLQHYMQERKEGYEGAVFRSALEKIKDSPNRVLIKNVERYAVVGFNALSACEVQYYQYLKAAAGTENVLFYWNYPASIRGNETENPENRHKNAGYFIRSHRTLGDALPTPEAFNTEQTVEIIAAPSVLSQADVVRELLQKQTTSEIETSVLVLPDEQLLQPILQALPKELAMNITMGYPLRSTLVYLFLENLLAWLETRAREPKSSSRKSLKSLLLHPFWQSWAEIQYALTELEKYTNDEVTDSELKETIIARWIADYESCSLSDFLLERLQELGDRLDVTTDQEVEKTNEEKPEQPIWLHYLTAAYGVVAELQQVLVRAGIEANVRLYRLLLPQVFRNKKIFYYGEPLSGLQIMGFLETRCLDFDQVTILSCNEGTLPAVHSTPSFILSSMCKGYNLPTLQDHELMYAYYFHTIVARAKHVRLIYAKTDGAGGGAEPSRYVLQYKYPLGESKSAAITQFLDFTFSHKESDVHKVQTPQAVPKEYCREAFESYLEQGVSPSALSTYCRCPLQFFYKYLARIEERQLPEYAEMSALDFGNLVHNSLRSLYAPLVGRELSEDTLNKQAEDVNRIVNIEFEKLRGKGDKNGIEQIECNIISKLLADCLARDTQRIPFTICALEHEVKGEIGLDDNLKVKLQGKIDRIDQSANDFFIIDYKTGQFDKRHAEFTSVAALFDGGAERDYVFQTFFYAYLLGQVKDALAPNIGVGNVLSPEHAYPSLWFVLEGREATLEISYAKKRSDTKEEQTNDPPAPHKQEGNNVYASHATEFETALKTCLATLVTSSNFAPTTERKRCEKCPYQLLCWGAKGCQ